LVQIQWAAFSHRRQYPDFGRSGGNKFLHIGPSADDIGGYRRLSVASHRILNLTFTC